MAERKYKTTASGRRIIPNRTKVAAARSVVDRGKTYQATANHFGITVGTVYQAVKRLQAERAAEAKAAAREKRRARRKAA